MRNYLGLVLATLSMSFAFGLECKLAVSEEECSRLHGRYQELVQEYERVADRMHINPSAYQVLHNELARIATFIGQPIPGSTQEETQDYATMYSESHLTGQDKSTSQTYTNMPQPLSMDYSGNAGETEASGLSERATQVSVPSMKGNRYGGSKSVQSKDHKAKTCNDSVSKERCDELLSQYAILKELYSNETTKGMLNMDAYNDLHRQLTEAGVSVGEKKSESSNMDMACHSSIGREHCEDLVKKYKFMKEMYNDADLKKMLNPDAYDELHREMEEAGIKIEGSNKGEHGKMSCDSSVPKEECDALLKKYELMKQMYNDADLKDMLNLDAYNELHQEMEEAGLKTDGLKTEAAYNKMSCDSSVPKEECDALLKKYELMKQMYNDADLKDMLNLDAYNELHQEMEEAGLKKDGSKTEANHKEMSCDSSVPKEECDALLQKYESMKDMYNNADLKDMLSLDAYNELHREMEEAGLKADGRKKEGSYTVMSCDSAVSKEECDALLRKYELMKEMYNDADLKKMLNPDSYNELHREMEEAGLTTDKKKKANHNKMSCDSSVPKAECDALLKKYESMKQMYNDADLKDMLNLDAYNELHREMEEAGINIDGKTQQKDEYSKESCDKSVSKDKCDALLKKYKLMKDMYSDADLKGMLNQNAYNELHREMEEAGIEVDRAVKGRDQQNYPLIRQCNRDGLYRYDDYSFIFCSEGLGFVQMCPKGFKNGQEEVIDLGYGRQMFCNTGIQYINRDTTEKVGF